jgi:photosystem II stability/assembly factor-like uncharacterized protein
MRTKVRARGGLIGALVVLAALLALPASAGASWTNQESHMPLWFLDVSCATEKHCLAVGEFGRARATTNGGASWNTKTLPTEDTLTGVSCVSPTTCWVVSEGSGGHTARIFKTIDGGSTWTTQLNLPADRQLFGLSCTSATHCWASGSSNLQVRATTNGGASWTAQTVGSGSGVSLDALSCVGTTHCWVVTGTGGIFASTNGGASWSQQSVSLPAGKYLRSISCASTAACAAVGDGSVIRVTSNGGASWTSASSSGTAIDLRGVDCVDSERCWAVGDYGTIMTRSTNGSWYSEYTGVTSDQPLTAVSCPSMNTCFVVGAEGRIATNNPPAPSASCTDLGGALFDGTLGPGYLKLRTERPGNSYPNRTWVCFRVGSSLKMVGGRIDVDDPGLTARVPTVDDRYDACTTTSGNTLPPPHPFAAGIVAGQPYLLDAYVAPGKAWICVRLGNTGKRVDMGASTSGTPGVALRLDQ